MNRYINSIYIFSTEDAQSFPGMLATRFQTKFIPVLSAFGVILVADVLHDQVSVSVGSHESSKLMTHSRS